MLGATRITSILGACPPGFDTAPLDQYNHFLGACADQGMHLLFITPGTKLPADYRTEQQKKRENEEWREQGNKGDAPAGVHLATNDKKQLRQYAKNARTHARSDLDPWVKTQAQELHVGPYSPTTAALRAQAHDKHREVADTAKTMKKQLRELVKDIQNEQAGSELSERFNTTVQRLGATAARKKEIEAADTWTGAYNDNIIQPAIDLAQQLCDGHREETGKLQALTHYAASVLEDSQTIDHKLAEEDQRTGIGSPDYQALLQEADLKADSTPLHLAIEPGASRVVIIDVDTPEETQALHYYWAQQTGNMEDNYVSPTIISPGVQTEDGAWKHQGGGHFYFQLPDNYTIPDTCPSTITVPVDMDNGTTSHFTLRIHDCYVIIPPSGRKEGYYRVLSSDAPWQPWIEDIIRRKSDMEAEKQKQRVDRMRPDAPSSVVYDDPVADFTAMNNPVELAEKVENWGRNVTWSHLLEPHGWKRTGTVDTKCGCDVWTAPGSHASPRSAVAHDIGCSYGIDGGGCLKIFTDNLDDPLGEVMIEEGTSSFSKLQVDAIYNHDGNTAAAMQTNGIPIKSTRDTGVAQSKEFVELLFKRFGPPDVDKAAAHITELIPFGKVRDMKPPEYLVDQTMEKGGLLAINGESGVGKSFVAIDLACSLVTGTPWLGRATQKIRVAYAPGEGRVGAVSRVRAWEYARREVAGRDYSQELNDNLFITSDTMDVGRLPDDPKETYRIIEMIKGTGCQLLILDTWARSIPGIDENSAEDVGRVIRSLDLIRQLSGCAVCVIHHTAKHDPTTGRGSNSLKGALDSELLVSKVEPPEGVEYPGKPIRVSVTKQKNTMEWEEPVFACVSEIEDVDPALEDMEVPLGFTTLEHSPGWGVVADVDGMICGAGLGVNNFVEKEPDYSQLAPRREPEEKSVAELCGLVWSMLSARGRISATKAEIVSSVSADAWGEEVKVTPRMRELVMVAVNVCLQANVVKKDGAKFKRNPLVRGEMVGQIVDNALSENEG